LNEGSLLERLLQETQERETREQKHERGKEKKSTQGIFIDLLPVFQIEAILLSPISHLDG
jgi:hypothetical protein